MEDSNLLGTLEGAEDGTGQCTGGEVFLPH